ncbi:MAG: DUF4440 domain-containing protein, partial [Gemmatimonadota bacterium]
MRRFLFLARLETHCHGGAALAIVLVAGLVARPLHGQNPAASPRATLLAADRAASSAVLKHGLAAGLREVMGDSVVFLYEGAPILSGLKQVAQVLDAQPALTRLKVQWLPVIAAVSSDGNFGVTSGPTVIGTIGQPADSSLRYGHYISVWRRNGETWKIVALIENGLANPDSVVMGEAARSVPTAPPIAGAGRPFADADIAFARLAADSGAPAAFGTWAAPDATTPPGGGPVTVGAAAIRARMQATGAGSSVWAWHPVHAGSSQSGDLGYT